MKKKIRVRRFNESKRTKRMTLNERRMLREHIETMRDYICDMYPEFDFVVNSEGENPSAARFVDGAGNYIQIDKNGEEYEVALWHGEEVLADETVDSLEEVGDVVEEYFV